MWTTSAAGVVGVDWERCRDNGDVMLTLETSSVERKLGLFRYVLAKVFCLVLDGVFTAR